MNTRQIIESAAKHLKRLEGHKFDVLTVAKPVSVEAAVNLAKVISKLSPLLGNACAPNWIKPMPPCSAVRQGRQQN